MLLKRTLQILLASTTLLTAGCASQDDLRLERRPPMPPLAVVKAAPDGRFYRNISIEEVQGAPEFLLFDGGGLITTRPTHKQVLETYADDLDRADLLAASRVGSEYMLYVKFEDLHGPDVWIASDKRSSARITFHLVRWRTGEVVKEQQIELAYVSKFPGLTPREAVAGSVGLAVGLSSGFTITRHYTRQPGISAFTADLMGAAGGTKLGVDSGELVLVALDIGSVGRFEPTPLSPTTELGTFNGTDRRSEATRGMLDLALDEFLHEVSKDGSIQYKKAVSCLDINPNGYRDSFLADTGDSFGVDCPRARYFGSRLFQAYPNNF